MSKLDAAAVAAFKAQVKQWAERIGVRPRQVRLQTMRRKWASCSTRGTVSFSTELLAQPAAFREYVIVHELLHLKVPNHGKLFKTLLRAYLPNYDSVHLAKSPPTRRPGEPFDRTPQKQNKRRLWTSTLK